MTDNKDIKAVSNDLLQLIVEGIQDRKGRKITVVDLSAIESAAAMRFVICQGTSGMHVNAVADSVREYVQKNGGVKPYNYDGYANSEWIVVDYGDTLVHIFLPDARERYNLEELWSDAVISEIADLD